MKIQKSAIPYIILLVGLLIGIPMADEYLQKENNVQVVKIESKTEIILTDLSKLP